MRVALALAAVTISLVGCEKSKAKIPDDPQPRPAALIATVALPNASALLPFRDLVAGINASAAMAVDPTIVMMTATSGVGAPSLEALDPAAPLYGLWLDDGKVRGLAIVGKIKDDDAISKLKPAESIDKNGWIVVAQSKEILALVAPYALTTVVATPPTHPTGTIYMPNVVTRYNDKLVAWRNTALQRVARGNPLATASAAVYFDGILSAIRQTDEIRIALDGSPTAGVLDLAVVPKSGSMLAGFVGAQKASDFTIAGKLPDKLGPAAVAGRITLGPYEGPVQSWIAALYGEPMGKDLIGSFQAIVKAMSGDVAGSAGFSPVGLTLYWVAGVTDAPAVTAAIDALQALFKENRTIETPHIKTTYKAAPDVVHDGVTLRVYDTINDTSKLSPKLQTAFPSGSRRTAVTSFDNLMLVAGTADAVADASRGIDAARGKGGAFAPSTELAAEITAATNRHDSLVAGFDLSLLGGKGVATGSLGFADHSIHIRVTLPTSVVRWLHP